MEESECRCDGYGFDCSNIEYYRGLEFGALGLENIGESNSQELDTSKTSAG